MGVGHVRAVCSIFAMLLVPGCGRVWFGMGASDAGGHAFDATPGRDGGTSDAAASPDAARVDADRVSDGGPDAATVDAALGPDAGATDGGVGTGCPGIVTGCPDAVRAIATGGSVVVTGTTDGLADEAAGSCGGAGAGELVVQLDVGGVGFYDVSTAGSTVDTVVYVRDGGCTGSEVGCVDAVSGSGGESLSFTAAHAGQWMLFVDAAPGQCGAIRVQIDG